MIRVQWWAWSETGRSAVTRTTIVEQLPMIGDRLVIPSGSGGALAWTVTERFQHPTPRRPVGRTRELERWVIYLRRQP